MVDKEAFEEIEENPWTDMEVTEQSHEGHNKRRGMHSYSKLQSMTLKKFRSKSSWLEVGCGG